MLKSLGSLIKLLLFSILILILGNSMHWGKRTISDEIKHQMAHAQETPTYRGFKHWTETLLEDAKEGAQKKWESISPRGPQNNVQSFSEEDDIPSSEKHKLKALIQELNY